MGRCDSEMTGVWSCPDQVCPDTVPCPSFNAVVSHHASKQRPAPIGVCHQQPFSTGLARNASGALSLAGAILIINRDYQSGTSPTTGADRS
jgi:hypothetical protein